MPAVGIERENLRGGRQLDQEIKKKKREKKFFYERRPSEHNIVKTRAYVMDTFRIYLIETKNLTAKNQTIVSFFFFAAKCISLI